MDKGDGVSGIVPSDPEPGAASPSLSHAVVQPTTGELFVTFLVIGASAFGMAILQSLRTIPVKRGWLSRDEIDEGFGLVQLYPGALMVDLGVYIGYRKHRVRGGLAAVAGFVTPSLLLLLGLSWAYFTFGTHPAVRHLVVGLDALVVGVLFNVATDFGVQYARDAIAAIVALGSFALAVAGANVLWAVLGGFVIGAIVWREPNLEADISTEPVDTGEAHDASDWRFSWRRLLGAMVPAVIVIAGAMVAAFASGSLAAVTADMSKIGAVAFGNGTAIMPVLQQDALAHHWLSISQFSAGVGFGQATPGPFLSTASFVGFAAAGWWGGVFAGVAIYAPSVAMTMIVAEVYPLLRRLWFVKGAIRGVMAAFTGLLAYMVLVLARPVMPVSAAIMLAAAAFVAVRILKWSTIVVFAGGLIVWGVYLAAGGAV